MEQADSGPDSGAEEQRWDAALSRLPATYALALRLRDAGVDDRGFAELLAVEPEAIDLLLAIAEAKLAALLEGPAL